MAIVVQAGKTVTLTADFGPGKASLATVGYALYKGDGTLFQARTTTGVVNVAGGIYRVRLAATVFPNEFDGYVLWDTGEGTPVYADEEIFVETVVADLRSGVVRVSSPVGENLNVTLVKGDDYSAAESRGLDWSTETSSEWPDLTGATVKMAVKALDGGAITEFTSGSVVVATGANKKVRVELTAAQTAALTVGDKTYTYDVQATLSGRKVTLARGYLSVLDHYAT